MGWEEAFSLAGTLAAATLEIALKPVVKIILVVMALALAAAGLWHTAHREPEWQGKTLSQWLDQFVKESDDEEGSFRINVPSAAAIREMGTNSFPTLLGMLSARDTPLRRTLTAALKSQPFIKRRLQPAQAARFRAFLGFWALEQQSAPVIPRIIALLRNADPEVRAAALNVLGVIGQRNDRSIPAVIEALNDPAPEVRAAAAYALFQLDMAVKNAGAVANRGACRPAVPVLLKAVRDGDQRVRGFAAQALIQIDPAIAAKVGVR